MPARIYQQPKSTMQSGHARTEAWVLDYEQSAPRRADPLMGWLGSADTQSQISLRFHSREEAVAYAERNAIPYQIELPHERRVRPKVYADNFRFGRSDNWTH